METKERLKELRKEHGLTQQELADKIGFSMSIVNKWENGKKKPSSDALIALANFYGEPIEYILGLKN